MKTFEWIQYSMTLCEPDLGDIVKLKNEMKDIIDS